MCACVCVQACSTEERLAHRKGSEKMAAIIAVACSSLGNHCSHHGGGRLPNRGRFLCDGDVFPYRRMVGHCECIISQSNQTKLCQCDGGAFK